MADLEHSPDLSKLMTIDPTGLSDDEGNRICDLPIPEIEGRGTEAGLYDRLHCT